MKALPKHYSEEQLPVVVKCVDEWSNDYLTVINNWNGILIDSLEGELPPVMSIITSINGKNAKGMEVQTFNDILMDNGSAELEFMKLRNGETIVKKCTITFQPTIYWIGGLTVEYPEDFPEYINIRNKKGIEFYKYRTFRYVLQSFKDLDEKSILETATAVLKTKGLEKVDNENSDLALLLETGKDQWNGATIILNILDGNKLGQGISQVLWSVEISGLSKQLQESITFINTNISKYLSNYPFDIPSFCNKVSTIGLGSESEASFLEGKLSKVLVGTIFYKAGIRSGDILLKATSYRDSGFSITWFPINGMNSKESEVPLSPDDIVKYFKQLKNLIVRKNGGKIVRLKNNVCEKMKFYYKYLR